MGYPNQVAEPNLNPDIDPELEQAMMSLKKKYKEVFDYEIELKTMKGKPAKIELKDGVIQVQAVEMYGALQADLAKSETT